MPSRRRRMVFIFCRYSRSASRSDSPSMNDAPSNAVAELVSGRHGKGTQMVNAD